GFDERSNTCPVKLLAQSADVLVDDVCLWIEAVVPDLLEQHRACHHASFMTHEIFEYAKFAISEVDPSITDLHQTRGKFDSEVAGLEPCSRLAGWVAAAKRLDPGKQLGDRKRLGEIIVTARPQAPDAFLGITERAE